MNKMTAKLAIQTINYPQFDLTALLYSAQAERDYLTRPQMMQVTTRHSRIHTHELSYILGIWADSPMV